MEPSARLIVLLALAFAIALDARAQGRTDVVTLANGDRITGEVVRLERGRLEFKTDDAGTLYLEWDKLASVVALRLVEVMTGDGRRFLGTLGATAARSIAVVTPEGDVTLAMVDVTSIAPIGRSFWRKLDGSIDAGFSYTQSSGVAQLNLHSDTVYRKPASQTRLTASLNQTQQDDESGRDDRVSVELSYGRYPWQQWFLLGVGRFERNESLGIELRSQIAGLAGPRLVNSNRGTLVLGGGLAFNDERGVDAESARNLEALLMFAASFYTYDQPKTTLDVSVQYYPSLSNAGRQRLQLDGSVKHELWKDFFISFSVYNSYDSRPPNPDAERNDVGVVASIGWSY